MKRSKPLAGRHLGWSEADRAGKPYARFLNPELAPLPLTFAPRWIAARCRGRCAAVRSRA